MLLEESTHSNLIKEQALPGLVDCAKLICNTHFQVSMHRRHQIYPLLKPDMQKVAKDSKLRSLLFGENLLVKYKTAQSLKRSGLDLKAFAKKKPLSPAPSTSSSRQYLNYQRPAPTSRFRRQNFVLQAKPYRVAGQRGVWDRSQPPRRTQNQLSSPKTGK